MHIGKLKLFGWYLTMKKTKIIVSALLVVFLMLSMSSCLMIGGMLDSGYEEEFSSNSSEPLIMSPSVASKNIRYLGRKKIWSKQVQVDAMWLQLCGYKNRSDPTSTI